MSPIGLDEVWPTVGMPHQIITLSHALESHPDHRVYICLLGRGAWPVCSYQQNKTIRFVNCILWTFRLSERSEPLSPRALNASKLAAPSNSFTVALEPSPRQVLPHRLNEIGIGVVGGRFQGAQMIEQGFRHGIT